MAIKAKTPAVPVSQPASASGSSNTIPGAESSSSSGSALSNAVLQVMQPSLMRGPSAGSANPSASFPALWNYIEPALDHIVRSPTPTPDKAPAIDVSYHMGIHTAVYNYFTTSRFDIGVGGLSPPPAPSSIANGKAPASLNSALQYGPNAPHGADLYAQLDRYYSAVCQELLAHAPPVDDSSLIHYILPCFHRYSAGARAVSRLLDYVNRHYVKRAAEEDRGWLRLADVLDAVAQHVVQSMNQLAIASVTNIQGNRSVTKTQKDRRAAMSSRKDDTIFNANDDRVKIAAQLKERRLAELRKWGYEEGGTPEDLARAEAAAEAASPTDRVVHLGPLAHRRFREEVIKHLLAIPGSGKKGKGKKKKYKKSPAPLTSPSAILGAAGSSSGSNAADGENNVGPKSRLARAVKELVECKDGGEEGELERRRTAGELNALLGTVGIPSDHTLRKRLERFSSLAK